MFCSYDVCVAWAHLRLANRDLAVHVGIKSVVPSSLTGYSLGVVASFFFFFIGEGFDEVFSSVLQVYLSS